MLLLSEGLNGIGRVGMVLSNQWSGIWQTAEPTATPNSKFLHSRNYKAKDIFQSLLKLWVCK